MYLWHVRWLNLQFLECIPIKILEPRVGLDIRGSILLSSESHSWLLQKKPLNKIFQILMCDGEKLQKRNHSGCSSRLKMLFMLQHRPVKFQIIRGLIDHSIYGDFCHVIYSFIVGNPFSLQCYGILLIGVESYRFPCFES